VYDLNAKIETMTKMFCINCGKDVPLNARYCPYCGAAQHGLEAATFRANAEPIVIQAAATANTAEQQSNVTPLTVDEFKDIEDKKLNGNAVWMLFFSYFVKTAILPGLLLFTLVVNPVIFVAGLVAYFVIIFISAEIIYNSFRYSADEIGFQKTYGVIHKMQVSIPYQQIQNVNIRRSFTDRMLGLSHVSIETAGSSNGAKQIAESQTTSEGYLPGLSLEDAKYLHDLLLSRSQDADS
jgi:membrane protein YdbS with pleckstrin-like domain